MNLSKINTKIYTKMRDMGFLELEDEDAKRIKNEPYMDLCFEWVQVEDGKTAMSLSHVSVMNGDLMRDPELVVVIHDDVGMAEAVYFRNDYLGIEQNVYEHDDDGKRKEFRPKIQKDLNTFLDGWLDTIKDQGFKIS